MAEENLLPKPVSFLFGKKFLIPYQQRGYKWTRKNVRVLIQDIWEFINSSPEKRMYCLQPITVIPVSGTDVGDVKEIKYEVIDGQQRLTTLYLLCKYLGIPSYMFEFERDKSNERVDFLEGNISFNDSCSDFFYISQAYKTIEDVFEGVLEGDEEPIFKKDDDAKARFIELISSEPEAAKNLSIIWSVDEDAMDDERAKHDSFRNINSGKIELSNADLIKAILLNEDNGMLSRERERIAVQLDQMEKQFAQDKFWFTFSADEAQELKGQSRIDLLYNLAMGITDTGYRTDARASFFKISELKSSAALLQKWEEIRDCYARLLSLYNDPYASQYVGFVTYTSGSGHLTAELVKEYKAKGKDGVVKYLKERIKRHFNKSGNVRIRETFTYDSSKKSLRELFVLHNIETLLHRYDVLKKREGGLQFYYERFPFELLYSQGWNIEHIASHTDNKMNTKVDCLDWAQSTTEDSPLLYESKKAEFDSIIQELEALPMDTTEPSKVLKTKINNLYQWCLMEDIKNGGLPEDMKNSIGNLVLLDEHTNKSFHNSFFPRKRSIVIVANGGYSKSEKIMKNTWRVYVPICTLQVYLKGYLTGSDIKLGTWTESDHDAYLKDIEDKLSYYFPMKAN